MVESVIVTGPKLTIPPPELMAELPLMVESVNVSVPRLPIPAAA